MADYDPYRPRNPAVSADDAMEDRRQTRGRVAAHGPNVAADQLRGFIERIERLAEEKQAIADDIKSVFGEAKSTGFDPKILREVIKIRRMDMDERMEREAILDSYLVALGMIDEVGDE